MPDAKLFNQCGAVTEQVCSGLRAHERRDGVGLASKGRYESHRREMEVGTHGVSYNEDGAIKPREVKGWKALDRANWPPEVMTAPREIRYMVGPAASVAREHLPESPDSSD